MTIHNYPTHGLKDKRYHLAYQYLMEKQEGLCLICGIHQSDVNKKFCIDHCHKTGKIRGLLCEGCNLSLGWAENMGCEALHTKISIEDINRVMVDSFNFQLMNDASFRSKVERGKLSLGQLYTEETYKEMHEKINRWMDKRKYAVYRYLSLPGLNEEIETYCNQFMRPRPTAK